MPKLSKFNEELTLARQAFPSAVDVLPVVGSSQLAVPVLNLGEKMSRKHDFIPAVASILDA